MEHNELREEQEQWRTRRPQRRRCRSDDGVGVGGGENDGEPGALHVNAHCVPTSFQSAVQVH
jgi:hypothetical protein